MRQATLAAIRMPGVLLALAAAPVMATAGSPAQRAKGPLDPPATHVHCPGGLPAARAAAPTTTVQTDAAKRLTRLVRTSDSHAAGDRQPSRPGQDCASSSSSSASLMRSTETTRSSAAVSNTMTPWVLRPAMRTPSTGTRMS